jgi:hypothetical protein
MLRGALAIIRNVSTELKAAGDLLRIIAFQTTPRREIRRAAQDKVKFLFGSNHFRSAKISVPNLIAL